MRKHGMALGLTVILLFTVLFGSSYVVNAVGEPIGPAVSNVTPAAGAVIENARPIFSLRFNTPNQLNTNVIVKIDGQSINPTITWDGLWKTEYDSCGIPYDVRVGDDHKNGVVSAQLPLLSFGQHTIYFKLTDLQNASTENTYNFTVSDAQGPLITEQFPANGSVIADPKPKIRVKLTDSNSIVVTKLSMKFNGSPVLAAYDSISSYATYNISQPLKNGTYQVEVSATDLFGNTSASSWSFTVNDNTAPVVTNLIPANASGTASKTPAIEATISDPSGIINPVYLQVDGQSLETQYNFQTGKISYVPSAPLSEGLHNVNLAVYDLQGNKATAAWAFTVHLDGPAISNLTPAAGSVTNDATPSFSLRFNDPFQLNTSVILKVDNQNITPTITWDGIWETQYDSCGIPYQVRTGDDRKNGVVSAQLPFLGLGQHTIYYNLKDGLGNITEKTYNFTVGDSQGPQITEQFPANGATIAGPKPVIKVKITDINSVVAKQVYMKFNGSPVLAAFDPISSYATYNISQPLKNGTYQVEVSATDLFGNTSASSWSFTVNDNTAPVVTNLIPANASGTASKTPAIEATISDPSGIINPVYLQVDGQSLETQYNFQTGKISYVPSAPLSEGLHNVNLAVYDLQGNKATAAWAFTVHLDGPAISNLTPAAGAVTNDATPLFSLRFNDQFQLNPNVILKVDNKTITPTVTWDGIWGTEYDSCGFPYETRVGDDYKNGVVSAQLPLLSLGQHTIYYSLKDNVGNATENTYTFVIGDTSGPQISEQFPANGATVAESKPVIKVKITDTNTVVASQVYMKFNGSPVLAVFDPVSSYATYTVPQPLKNGIYPVEVSAADLFGNTSASSWSFTVNDVTPPTVTNLVPGNNSGVATTTPVIQATLSDPSGVVNPVYLQIDGSNSEVAYNAQTGKISYTPGSPLSEGQHTVNVYAYDLQGNKATATWAFTVRLAGPAVSELTPAPGAVLDNIRPKISFRIEDPFKVNTAITLKIDNQNITPTVTWEGIWETRYDSCGVPYDVWIGNDYTKGIVTAQLQKLNLGEHSVYYKLTDTLGNITEKTYTFTVSDTEGPKIVQSTPANGAVITNAKPAITVKLGDANNIVAGSVYMVLNGQRVNFSYDAATQTAFYQPQQLLPNEVNTVHIQSADELGNTSDNILTFTVNDVTGSQFSNMTPANGSTITNSLPVISVKVTDENGLDNGSVSMELNGNKVGTFYPGLGLMSYTPPEPLIDGTYTVTVSAYDVFKNKGTATWTFTVKDTGIPIITNMIPPPTMGTKTLRPTISANIWDNAGIDLKRLSITVDGVPLTPSFKSNVPGSILAGVVYAVPEVNLSNATHTAVVTVFDVTGKTKQVTWKFGVNTFVEMGANTGDCLVCHNEGIAVIEKEHLAGQANCDACHGLGVLYDHGDYSCADCHGGHSASWPPPIGYYACTTCHNSNNWNTVPTHGSPNELSPHNYTGLGQDCQKCHYPGLTKEHNVYVEGRGYAYNCSTCHQSSDPAVSAAISRKDNSCLGCHGDKANHEALHNSSLDQACQTCHAGSLTTEHLIKRSQAGLNCASCHNDNVLHSGYNAGTNCAGCHSTAHDALLTVGPDIPLYSGLSWSAPFDARIYAGEAWMPQEYLTGGKLLVSKRSTEITGLQIRNYYKTELEALGWALASDLPAEQSNYYNMTFTKNERKVRISFYGGENHTGTPPLETGFRVEILYK